MNDAWFNPGVFAGVLGAAFGCTAGLWGCAAGILAAKGKARSLVLGWGWVIFAASIVCLAAGVYAYAIGQPYGIWYGLGLVGVLGCVIFPYQLVLMRRKYAEHESRRMQIEDLF